MVVCTVYTNFCNIVSVVCSDAMVHAGHGSFSPALKGSVRIVCSFLYQEGPTVSLIHRLHK